MKEFIEFKDELGIDYIPNRFRTAKVNLVLFGGKAGVGKTTAANHVLEHFSNHNGLVVELTPLAKPIKELAHEWFKWDGNKDGKGRRLLQVLGTDAGRAYNENIWMEFLDNSILSTMFVPHIVLVDDWRFPNEASYFENNFMYDVTKVRIESSRSNLPENTSSHLSENAMPDDYSYHFVIENDGTMEEFYKKLDSVIGYLQTKLISY